MEVNLTTINSAPVSIINFKGFIVVLIVIKVSCVAGKGKITLEFPISSGSFYLLVLQVLCELKIFNYVNGTVFRIIYTTTTIEWLPISIEKF